MRVPEYSTQFRRDVKRAQKRGKELGKLKAVLHLLISGEKLPSQLEDHALKNDWSGYRDAHLEPDWLLIYWADENTVRFERTGTHADLLE